MESVGKKKKKTTSRKRATERQIRIILRPNQSLGATFEYHEQFRALQISEFVPNSAIQHGGVLVGMFLTEIDDLNVVGLKQNDVIFLLQQKASALREIVFSNIDTSSLLMVPDRGQELRSQSASLGRDALPSPSADDRYSLPHLQPAITPSPKANSNASLLSNQHAYNSPLSGYRSGNRSSALCSPSSAQIAGSTPLSTYGYGGGESTVRYTSSIRPPAGVSSSSTTTAMLATSATSAPSTSTRSYSVANRSLRHTSSDSTMARGVSNSTASAPYSSSSDPFSTPARRRRLVADISKFLLKQYCMKACDNVHLRRVRFRSAVVIQCAFRCCMARRLLFRLLFAKKTFAATTLQNMYRCWAAREEFSLRIRQRHVARTIALAKKLQCRFRNRKALRELQHLKLERAELLHRMNTAAVCVQKVSRMFAAKMILWRKKKEREQIQHLKQRAALRLECMYRQRVARRVVDNLRRLLRTENGMARRIAEAWRSYMKRRYFACTCIQRVFRGELGRRRARRVAEETRRRRDELTCMRLEDELSHILRDQDTLEICVDIEHRLLYELKGCSAPDLVKWCLRQSLLSYDPIKDEYAVGIVICKAIQAANLHTSDNTQSLAARASDDDMCNRVEITGITAAAANALPDDGSYPMLWGERYKGRKGVCLALMEVAELEEQIHYMQEGNRLLNNTFRDTLVGTSEREQQTQLHTCKALTVMVNEKDAIVLHIENPAKSRRSGDSGTQQPDHNSVDNADIFIMLQATDARIVDDDNDRTHTGEEMMNLKFKDIIVSISLTSVQDEQPPPESGVVEKHVEEIMDSELGKDNTMDPVEDEIINDIVDDSDESVVEVEEVVIPPRPSTAAASRPSTATARVKVSIIDEEALQRAMLEAEEARKREEEEARAAAALRARQAQLAQLTRRAMVERIQRNYRRHKMYQRCVCAALMIQRMVKRSRILSSWQSSVYEVLRLSNFAAVQLQKQVRMILAKKIVEEIRLELCWYGTISEDRQRWEEKILRDYSWAPGGSGVDDIEFDNTACALEDCVRQISGVFVGTVSGAPTVPNESDVDHSYQSYSESAGTNRHQLSHNMKSGNLWFTSVENTVDGPYSLQGSGPWAANMLHILEFPQAPNGCILPHDILLHIPDSSEGDYPEGPAGSACGNGNSDHLFDDLLDCSYTGWQRMADFTMLYGDGTGVGGSDISSSLGDICHLKRRVHMTRYMTRRAEVPMLYKIVAANFTSAECEDISTGRK